MIRTRSRLMASVAVALAAMLLGCGGDAESPPAKSAAGTPWGNDVTVVQPDRTVKDYPTPRGDACIDVGTAQCVSPQERCGDGVAADVILDDSGKVADLVCYPTSGTLTPETIQAQKGDVSQNENGAVIVLDAAPDGIDLDGDLSLDANRVVLYGEGPEVSVISGTVTVDGNNTVVRGVRIQGDLEVAKNDSVFLFCVVEGNVHIIGNNTRVSGCDIYGSVTIEGNNTIFSGNHLQDSLKDEGKNTTCEGNRSFRDQDQDRVVDANELGADVGCKSK